MKAKIILIIMAILSAIVPRLAGASFATDPTDNAGSARSKGMGNAYVAVSDDVDAVFVNQAGLAGLKVLNVTGMYYSRVFNSFHYFIGAGAMPTQYGTFGIGLISITADDFVDTTDPLDLGSFSNYDNALEVSYGTSLSRFWGDERRLYVGGSLKFFSRGYSGSVTKSGTGTNMDLGLKYVPVPWISFGLMKHNIINPVEISWDTGTSEALESPTKVGASMRFFDNKQIVALDYNMSSHPGQPSTWHLGTEYRLTENFTLRGGLDQIIDAASTSGTATNVTLGLGIEYLGFKLDYAYQPYYDFADNVTHYISLSYKKDPSDFVKVLSSKDKADQKYSMLEKLPGKIYDDLGNVVSYDPYYFLMKHGIKPSKGCTITPVVCEIPDYSGMYFAYVYSDVTVAKKNLQPERYMSGDIMPIITKAPADTDKITAVMPNGEEVALTYDKKAKAWHGIWEIPDGIKEGTYKAKIIAIDFEGYKIETETSAFTIGEPAKGTVEAPPAPSSPISPEVSAPQKKVIEEPSAKQPVYTNQVSSPESIAPAPKVSEMEISWKDVFIMAENCFDKKLDPDQKLTRAGLVYLIAEAKGYNLDFKLKKRPFKDVLISHWAAHAIAKSVERGIINGYPHKQFKPKKRVSYAELISIISGAENFDGKNIYGDNRHWAMPCIKAATAAGMLRSNEIPKLSEFNQTVNLKTICELLSRTKTFRKALKK